MKTECSMSIEEVLATWAYDAETGVVYWINRQGNKSAGAVAGSVKRDGYIRVGCKEKSICAHRIAWAIAHKEWPDKSIDHVNGVRSDNRIANLRLVDPIENSQNRRTASKNKGSCDAHGVTLHKQSGKWQAAIQSNRKTIYIGLFDSVEQASSAYLAAKAELHPFQTIAGGKP
jgi:hypothetical protein